MLKNDTAYNYIKNRTSYYPFLIAKYLPDYVSLDDPIALDTATITILLGASGIGKTSIVNACIDECLDKKLDFAYQNQHTTLLHHKTVLCNLKLPFKLQGKSIERNRLLQVLKDVFLYHHRYKKVSQLSKGMQQRLQLAMAIIQDVPLYFFDEPFSSQDTKMRQHLYKIIQQYCKKKTVLIVTHCEHDLHLLTRTILHLEKKQGILRVVQKTQQNILHNKPAEISDDLNQDQQPKLPPNKTSTIFIYRLFILGAVLLLWTMTIKTFSVPSYIVPEPFDVAISFYNNAGILVYHLFHSVMPLLIGVCVAILSSTVLALIFYRYKHLTRAIEPFLVGLQSVPVFLILPILLYVCGSSIVAKVAALSITTFFPLFAGILQGLGKTPVVWELQKAALKAPEHRFLYYVRLIYAVPFIWQGLRLSLIHAPLSVLAVDWIGASAGLGYLIMLSHSQLELPLMFCGLIIVIALCLCLNYGAKVIDKKFIQ